MNNGDWMSWFIFWFGRVDCTRVDFLCPSLTLLRLALCRASLDRGLHARGRPHYMDRLFLTVLVCVCCVCCVYVLYVFYFCRLCIIPIGLCAFSPSVSFYEAYLLCVYEMMRLVIQKKSVLVVVILSSQGVCVCLCVCVWVWVCGCVCIRCVYPHLVCACCTWFFLLLSWLGTRTTVRWVSVCDQLSQISILCRSLLQA